MATKAMSPYAVGLATPSAHGVSPYEYPAPGPRMSSPGHDSVDGPPFTSSQQLVQLSSHAGPVSVSLNARVEKGFFIAEHAWTCYRRNYFSISASVELKPSIGSQSLYVVEDKQYYAVRGLFLGLSARIQDSDKVVELVQHTPKRDKGPLAAPAVQEVDVNGPVGDGAAWDRIQFKSATANNGKRKAAQQYFIVTVELRANTDQGVKLICQRSTVGCVVRGRSPGHYHDHEEARQAHLTSPTTPGANGGFPRARTNSSSASAPANFSAPPPHSLPTPLPQIQHLPQLQISAPFTQSLSTPTYSFSPAARGPTESPRYMANPYNQQPSPSSFPTSNAFTPISFLEKYTPSAFDANSAIFPNNLTPSATSPFNIDFASPQNFASPRWRLPAPNTPVANSPSNSLPMITDTAPPNFNAGNTPIPPPSPKDENQDVECGERKQTKEDAFDSAGVPTIRPASQSKKAGAEIVDQLASRFALPTFEPLDPEEEKQIKQSFSGYQYFPATLAMPGGMPVNAVDGLLYDPHASHTNLRPNEEDHNCMHASGVAWRGMVVQPYVPTGSPARRSSSMSVSPRDALLRRESVRKEKEKQRGSTEEVLRKEAGEFKEVGAMGRFEWKMSSRGYYPDLQPV